MQSRLPLLAKQLPASPVGHSTTQMSKLLLNSAPMVVGTGQITQKRYLFYQYLTKSKEEYEEWRKRTKPRLRFDRSGRGRKNPMSFVINSGNLEDPEIWIFDKEYAGSPRFGDKIGSEWIYRDVPTMVTKNERPFLDRFGSKFVATLMWFWFLYHLYWNNSWFIGHFYLPYLDEFSNEELGIPPDNAPDPIEGEQYWGHHGRPYRTYR